MSNLMKTLAGVVGGKAVSKANTAVSTPERQLEAALQHQQRIFSAAEAFSSEISPVGPRQRLLAKQREAIARKVRRLRFEVVVRDLHIAIEQCLPAAAEAIKCATDDLQDARQRQAVLQSDLERRKQQLKQVDERVQALKASQDAEERAARTEMADATIEGDDKRIKAAEKVLESVLSKSAQGSPTAAAIDLQHSTLVSAVLQLDADLNAAAAKVSAAVDALKDAELQAEALQVESAILHAAVRVYELRRTAGTLRLTVPGTAPPAGPGWSGARRSMPSCPRWLPN